jgi:hypothetical protein
VGTTAKPRQNLVSAAHVLKFDRFLSKWQRLLNLMDWRVVRGLTPAGKTAMADTKIDLESRLATVRLGSTFGRTVKVDARSLEETALHEDLHVFLAPLITFARDPNVSDEDLLCIEHGVINVLEQLLLQDNRGAR